MQMPIFCFGTKIKLCKTIYILKGYTDSYSDFNRNLYISPYFFRNGSCKFMQLAIFFANKFVCTFFD